MSFAAVDATVPNEIHETLATELYGVVDVDGVHLCEVVQDLSRANGTTFERRRDGRAEAGARYVAPFDRPSGAQHVMRTGRPLIVPDVTRSHLVARALAERFGVASILFVPLSWEGGVRAVVLLLTHTPRRFEDEEVELVYTMANQAAAGLAVLEMRSRIGGQADKQAALARAAGALNASLEQREVLSTLCREADLAVGADMSGVYLGSAEEGGLAVAGHGIRADSDWWGYRIMPGEGVAGLVLATGEPAISNDYQHEVRVPGLDVMGPIQTAVSVPMRWGGRLRGALSVAFYSMRRVAQEDIDTLQAIAELAAVACRNAEAFEQAQAAARLDSLTGLLNHGAIQVHTSEEIWRARRAGSPLTCLLSDLDNFKPINDRHGHLVGDEVLRRVSAALSAEFRPYDGLARYGGDEFVLLLPETDERGAQVAAVRLRECVAEAGRAVSGGGLPLTASVGIAEWCEPLTAGELLGRADRALLLAKRRGKDGLAVADPETERELTEMDSGGAPSRLMDAFWDTVSRCEEPRDLMFAVPSLLRRELALEEAAVFEPGLGPGGDRALVRLADARMPGDPGRSAFRGLAVSTGAGMIERLSAGPVARSSLGELRLALELPPPADDADPSLHGSYAAVALARRGEALGLLLLRHSAPEFPLTALRMAEMVAGHAVTVLVGQSGGGSRTAVAALAAAIDARDNYTLSHSSEVVALACEVAGRLGLDRHEIARVRDGAMLHDVGKVAIPNEILYKQGPLDDEEWEVMRQHPVIGEKILLDTPELADIAPLVRHEHERWDGAGYPDGLAGEAIPVGSRIILACDAYNAMITSRPYREPMTTEAAIAELRDNTGTQFDPQVVESLVHILSARKQPAVASAAE